jgi:hypothetical protein
MSYKLSDAARVIYLPATEKAVLRVLCDHAHDDGTESRASIYTLTMESGFKRTAVRSAIDVLLEQKFISETVKEGRPTVYKILLPNADVVAAMMGRHTTRSR